MIFLFKFWLQIYDIITSKFALFRLNILRCRTVSSISCMWMHQLAWLEGPCKGGSMDSGFKFQTEQGFWIQISNRAGFWIQISNRVGFWIQISLSLANLSFWDPFGYDQTKPSTECFTPCTILGTNWSTNHFRRRMMNYKFQNIAHIFQELKAWLTAEHEYIRHTTSW